MLKELPRGIMSKECWQQWYQGIAADNGDMELGYWCPGMPVAVVMGSCQEQWLQGRSKGKGVKASLCESMMAIVIYSL